MRKNQKYIIFILIVLIIQVSSVYFIQSTTKHPSYSKFKEKNVDLEEKNIERKIREDLHSSENPGNFTLSTDKISVYVGFNFTLSWTVSEGANNYSIYMSTKNITIIDGNSTLIKGGLTKLNQSLVASNFGLKYYVAVAYNESGNTLSNCVRVNILELEEAETNGKGHFGEILSGPLIIIVLIGIVILLSTTGIVSYKHRKAHISIPVTEPISYDVKDNDKKYEKVATKEVQGVKKIKYATKILNDLINNDLLLDLVSNEGEVDKVELNLISEDFLYKVDTLKWDEESQKVDFIREMLALTPEERDDILSYMIEKSNKNDIYR